MTLRYYYSLPGTNAGQHLYGGSSGYMSCLPRVPATPRGDPFMLLSLVATAWLGGVALLLVTWDTPLPPNVYFRCWRLLRVLFSTGPNHLSQCVRHHAKGCVALGWILASVVNDPLRAPGSTPLYLCLPTVWGAVGGNLLNPHYLWRHYGDQNKKKRSPQDLKRLPSRRSL
jgi:hypothetical protein